MSCDLTIGRALPCKESVGGLKNVYFIDYGTLGTPVYDATDTDAIDSFPGAPDAYQWDLKGTSSFTQNVNSDRATGTTFYEQVLELTFTKLDKKTHKELKLIAWARPHVIVEDYNGNLFLMGLEHGAEVTGGTIVTGAAMGELSGYTLSLTATERVPANFIDNTLSGAGVAVSASQIDPTA